MGSPTCYRKRKLDEMQKSELAMEMEVLRLKLTPLSSESEFEDLGMRPHDACSPSSDGDDYWTLVSTCGHYKYQVPASTVQDTSMISEPDIISLTTSSPAPTNDWSILSSEPEVESPSQKAFESANLSSTSNIWPPSPLTQILTPTTTSTPPPSPPDTKQEGGAAIGHANRPTEPQVLLKQPSLEIPPVDAFNAWSVSHLHDVPEMSTANASAVEWPTLQEAVNMDKRRTNMGYTMGEEEYKSWDGVTDWFT
ncbi:hypothetical protein N0V90_000919 [Kalmusia sp. IMI 367209]|nr:hypothetical protein N0V90_000919 [Kalmusia sp. IMI 367209]